MKQIKYLIFGVALSLLLITVGCQGNQNEEGMYDRTNEDNRFDNMRNDTDGFNDMTDGDRTTRNNRNNNLDNDRIENRTDRMTNRNQDQDHYDVAEESADKITDEMDDINHAYVLTTKNNAYVAVKKDDNDDGNNKQNSGKNMSNDRNRTEDNEGSKNTNNRNIDAHEETLTEDVKREISDIVKSVDDDIDNVYVSTNPDFSDLTNDYIKDMNDGRPIGGLFDEIGNMIERVFPQNR